MAEHFPQSYHKGAVRVDHPLAILTRSRKLLAAVGTLLIMAAVLYAFFRGPDWAGLAAFGYPGIAILMFLASTTIVLPAPGFAAVFAAGTVWNPFLVGICAGLGAATGEMTGYLLGMSGGTLLDLKSGKNWQRMHRWLEKYGMVAIFLLAATPNPFFDFAGMVAGSVSYSLSKFWVSCAAGKIVKYTAMALMSTAAVAWWPW